MHMYEAHYTVPAQLADSSDDSAATTLLRVAVPKRK